MNKSKKKKGLKNKYCGTRPGRQQTDVKRGVSWGQRPWVGPQSQVWGQNQSGGGQVQSFPTTVHQSQSRPRTSSQLQQGPPRILTNPSQDKNIQICPSVMFIMKVFILIIRLKLQWFSDAGSPEQKLSRTLSHELLNSGTHVKMTWLILPRFSFFWSKTKITW